MNTEAGRTHAGRSRPEGSARDTCADSEPSRDSPGVSIVVPTYREAENIPGLVSRIDGALSPAGIEWELILVDDNSDDGSDTVVDGLARDLPVRIEIRRCAARDLSLSVLRGFELAAFDTLVVLDADLSHPPERIVDLLAALDDGCDMAVGSRYAPGGFVERRWNLADFMNSRAATALARHLTNCSDPMSGFFAVRRRVLPDPAKLHPIGYKIGLELMVRGRLQVREVPILFATRVAGSSKTGWLQRINAVRHLCRLYVFKYGGAARALIFGLVGASGLAVDVAVYLGLASLGLEHRLARLASFWPAVTWNWLLNRGFTFGELPKQPRMRQWARFTAASLVGLGANVGGYAILTTFVPVFDRHRLVALLFGVALGSALNFTTATLYVYRRHSAPEPGTRQGSGSQREAS